MKDKLTGRLKGRLKGLAALALAMVFVLTSVSTTYAYVGPEEGYFFVMYQKNALFLQGEAMITGTGDLYSYPVQGNNYVGVNGDGKLFLKESQSGLTLLSEITDAPNENLGIINEDKDVQVHTGTCNSGSVFSVIKVNGKEQGTTNSQNTGLGFKLPAGKYSVTHTSTNAIGESGNFKTYVIDIEPILSTITVDPATATLEVGQTKELIVQQAEAAGKVTWSTDKESVATVDNTGKVTAVGAGEATITATYTEDPTVTSTCKVTVTEPEVYKVTSGDGSTYEEGTDGTLTFTFKRTENDEVTFEHFTGVKVDGKEIDNSNYDAKKGSVVITLKAAYLKTLSKGDHVISAMFDDGPDATATFSVTNKKAAASSSATPATATSSSTSSSTSGSTSGSKAGTTTGTSAISPKTSDGMMFVFLMLAATGAAGAVLIGKRRKND